MATSLDDILQADRLKRRNEKLANQLLGPGRRDRTTAPAHNGVASPILPNPRPFRDNPLSRKFDGERLSSRLARTDLASNAIRQATVQDGGEISIRGAAGPYVVVGANFAPGTTAADIESAMAPIGGELLGCEITNQRPTVIAEMVFTEKAKAENVIATFNNKRADGRILRMYMRVGKPSVTIKPTDRALPRNAPDVGLPYDEPSASEPPPNAPSEPRAARNGLQYEENWYSKHREQTARNRPRAEPEVQDGSYGFEAKEDRMDVDNDNRRNQYHEREKPYEHGRDMGRPREQRRLYSDDIYRPRGRGFR
ncbi:MAG: hypothetical protein Q9219_005700 [cf. Caloplaca sp. 3 TL-2023]